MSTENLSFRILVATITTGALLGACGVEDSRTRTGDLTAADDLSGILFGSIAHDSPRLYVTDTSGKAIVVSGADFDQYSGDWSPDRSQIVFIGNRDNPDLYIMKDDGSEVQRILRTPEIEGDATWSPDGRTIFFWQSSNDGTWQVKQLDLQSGEVSNVRGTANGDSELDIAPLADRIGVVRNVGGQMSVQLLSLSGEETELVLTNGAGSPSWSPSGRQVAFVDDAGTVQVADLDTGLTTKITLPDEGMRASIVEWGPSAEALLVAGEAVEIDSGKGIARLYLADTATGEVSPLDVGLESLDFFGGISWQ
ncbi:MAG: hypothetical protein LH630_05325 [Actinomycetia bacterium]|nr:hypothetical protein [Actinomycetes bacterium]